MTKYRSYLIHIFYSEKQDNRNSNNDNDNSMEVVIGLCRHDSLWDRYLIRVKYVARLLACVTITATSSGGLIVKIHEYFVYESTEHLNSIDENIKFTPNRKWKASCRSWTRVPPSMMMALWISQYTEKTHTQTSIWTLTLTTISNTRGLLYEHSLTEQTAWSSNRSRKVLRADMSIRTQSQWLQGVGF